MKFIFRYFTFVTLMVFVASCSSTKQNQVKAKPKPSWVLSRPVDQEFYTGIGTAAKSDHPLDYQQIAKKNALDDMVSEIRVTVSSNQVLKSVQNNLEFKQQFNATTKVTALNTVEKFDVVDNWENAGEFWIYYRLSKAEYEAAKRRKMQVQIDRALDFLTRADQMNISQNFVQIVHMKIQALASMQNYLNEDVIASYHDKDVKLVDVIFNSIQDQLYAINYVTSESQLKGVIGKSLPPFSATATINNHTPIVYLPLKAGSENAGSRMFDRIETDDHGVSLFTNAKVVGSGSTLFLKIVVDMEKLITVDSLSPVIKSILLSMQPPPASIKVEVMPLKIFMEDNEMNLSKTLEQSMIEPLVKKELSANGCVFTNKKEESDYTVRIHAQSKQEGVMWGTMLGASVEARFSVIDTKSGMENYSSGTGPIKGYQSTYESAGLDAYKKSIGEIEKKFIPALINGLFSAGN